MHMFRKSRPTPAMHCTEAQDTKVGTDENKLNPKLRKDGLISYHDYVAEDYDVGLSVCCMML